MEVQKFMNEKNKLSHKELKGLLEKEYKLKVIDDKNNNYYMISTTNNSDFNNIFIRQCTGIILEKNTNKILHYFGNKTYDIFNKYNNNIINLKNINFQKCYLTSRIHGNIIKLFNYKKKWFFATSKHTDIKYFKIKNTTLYNLFKNCILESFESIYDFLNLLNENYCYSFVLQDNSLSIINKISLTSLKEEINLSNYKPLNMYNIKNDIIKYIVIEKDSDDNIIKKIHINIEDIRKMT